MKEISAKSFAKYLIYIANLQYEGKNNWTAYKVSGFSLNIINLIQLFESKIIKLYYLFLLLSNSYIK